MWYNNYVYDILPLVITKEFLQIWYVSILYELFCDLEQLVDKGEKPISSLFIIIKFLIL